MLEFIVLGQIPGTHLQITIAWFVFGLLATIIWLDLKFHLNPKTKKTVSKKVHTALNRVRA